MPASRVARSCRGGASIDPTAILRDFDRGKTSLLPDGRTLRVWDIVAVDKDFEIAPGQSFSYEFDATPFGTHLYHCHPNVMRLGLGCHSRRGNVAPLYLS